MKHLKTIENVNLGIDKRGIVYNLPVGMSGAQFKAFKTRNKQSIQNFKDANL